MMPLPLIITLCVVAGVWLLLVSLSVINLIKLNNKIKRRQHAINVLLAQKYDLLVTLGKYMEQNGAFLPDNIKQALDIQDYNSLKTINTQERLSVKTLLMKTVNTMYFIAEEHGMRNSERYMTLKQTLNEIDEQHRKDIAFYNADVSAYNYWVKFIPFRPISFIFRIKIKEIMY